VRETEAATAAQEIMDDVDIEIHALEELIGLQKKKVELLSRKRIIDNERKLSEDNGHKERGVELRYSRKSSTEKTRAASTSAGGSKTSVISTAVNAINRAMHDSEDLSVSGQPNEEEEQDEEEEEFDENAALPASASTDQNHHKPSDSRDSNVFQKWFKKGPDKKEKTEERFVDALTRLSRLTTDLANERTYLAWIRTALASARTVVSFLALSGTNLFGRVSAKTCVIGFAVLALFMMGHGTERYRKIKQILLTKDTPGGFARLTTAPLSIALLSVFALVIFVTSSENWVN
jgi:uncharacterized membrane protein YidH (DUF202 family)